MAGITLEQAEAQLALYLDAEEKILAGQAVERAGKRLTRADLESVQRGIEIWNARVNRLAAGGRISTVEVIPI